jgi:hypothetical protein
MSIARSLRVTSDSFCAGALPLAAALKNKSTGATEVARGVPFGRWIAVTFERQGHPTGAARGEAHATPAFEQTRAGGVGVGTGRSSCRRQIAATWWAIRAAVVISLSGDLTRSWKFQSMFQFGAFFLLGCCSCSSICSASSRHCCAKSAYINRASNVTARLPARSQCCALARHVAALSLISSRYYFSHGRAIAAT